MHCIEHVPSLLRHVYVVTDMTKNETFFAEMTKYPGHVCRFQLVVIVLDKLDDTERLKSPTNIV